jgi:hypothetical protein
MDQAVQALYIIARPCFLGREGNCKSGDQVSMNQASMLGIMRVQHVIQENIWATQALDLVIDYFNKRVGLPDLRNET